MTREEKINYIIKATHCSKKVLSTYSDPEIDFLLEKCLQTSEEAV